MFAWRHRERWRADPLSVRLRERIGERVERKRRGDEGGCTEREMKGWGGIDTGG